MVETFQEGGKPTFVDQLDAVDVAKKSGMPLAPIMIYGDDVTHLLTEEGIAYLYKADSQQQREEMIAAVAGSLILVYVTIRKIPNAYVKQVWWHSLKI
jgi:malonate decarboxylase alpha subunit